MGNVQANSDLSQFRVKQLKTFIISNGGELPKNQIGLEIPMEKTELIRMAERIQDLVSSRPVAEGEIGGGYKEGDEVHSVCERVNPNDDDDKLLVGTRGVVVGGAPDHVDVQFKEMHGDTVFQLAPFNLSSVFPPTAPANLLTASINKILKQDFKRMSKSKLEETRDSLRRKCKRFEGRKDIIHMVSARTEELKTLREEAWDLAQREWDKMTRERPDAGQQQSADAKTKTAKHVFLTSEQRTRDCRKKVQVLEAQLAEAKAALELAEAEEQQSQEGLSQAQDWAGQTVVVHEEYEDLIASRKKEVTRRREASKKAAKEDEEWDKAREELESAVSAAGVKASLLQSQLGYTSART